MAAHARLKNVFTEDEKCHNLMTWLKGFCNLCYLFSPTEDTKRLVHAAELWQKLILFIINGPPHIDKTNKMTLRQAKTQISLGIRPVWSESSLCAHAVAKDSSFLHADSEDSDQTGRMPRLIWVFAGRTGHFVGIVMHWLILFFLKFLDNKFYGTKTFTRKITHQRRNPFLSTLADTDNNILPPGLYMCRHCHMN